MLTFSVMSPWVWFVIAGLAAAAGSVLLVLDRGHHSAHQRERRRWAALRGWRFVLSDPVLADRWRHGVLAQGGAGLARDIVVGTLFTPLGRRVAQVFDHEQGGQVSSVVVAVQRRDHGADLVAELWLPDRPLPRDPELTMLGSVGDRVALVSDPDRAGPLLSPEFVFAVGALGPDVPVAWAEQDWVLAAAPCSATPARLERLLRALDEIADLLDVAGLDVAGLDVADEPVGFVDSADRATS
ncbi:MAG: hypothetical protein ACRDRI_16050 [Pseudonocardiaceae bacterium]